MIEHQPINSRLAAGRLPNAASTDIVADNTPAKPMAAPAVTLKSRGFFIACMSLGPLRRTPSTINIIINIPAKPMWTSVLKLKLRGFFIALLHGAPTQGPRRLTSEGAQ